MKIFIRDTGEGNARRQQIIQNLESLSTPAQVSLAINERDPDTRLYLYHVSDIERNRTEYSCIEKTVSEDPSKLLIRYSGVVKQPRIPVSSEAANIWEVPPQCVIDNLARFIDTYLKESRFEAEVLLGNNLLHKAIIKLLNKFLAMDVALQLGDVEKSLQAATTLLDSEQQQEIAALFGGISDRQIVCRDDKLMEASGDSPAERTCRTALKLLNRLLSLARGRIVGSLQVEKQKLQELSGHRSDGFAAGVLSGNNVSLLMHEGFHSTFEELRDELINIAEESM